ncbi:MAG: hypothetical protein PHQ20_04215 [Candidatus Moranbacteria bacterium]|nr:hypothetical protein [Candidatus Moranbacteria bacterium]
MNKIDRFYKKWEKDLIKKYGYRIDGKPVSKEYHDKVKKQRAAKTARKNKELTPKVREEMAQTIMEMYFNK